MFHALPTPCPLLSTLLDGAARASITTTTITG